MLTSSTQSLFDGRVIKFVIESDSAPISYLDVIDQWQEDAKFRAFFISLLKNVPFTAFRWETPPVTLTTADQPFEFVILDSPELDIDPDPAPFNEHFADMPPGGVVEFPNLGGDALLVVPCPHDARSNYGHLAAYLRNSPNSQQHLLWERVGAVMQRRLDSRPVWLSAAGGGVAWLHLRLDDRPKYYGYAVYRDVGWRQGP